MLRDGRLALAQIGFQVAYTSFSITDDQQDLDSGRLSDQAEEPGCFFFRM